MTTNNYPAITGDAITERHARICREQGHATWTRDGQDVGQCPRCGHVEPRATTTTTTVVPIGTNTPHLPYASGCRHASPCANVYAGRACALDDSKRNGYDDQGHAYVEFVTADDALGIAHGSRLLAVDPYTGHPSGVRTLPSGDTVRAYQAGEWS